MKNFNISTNVYFGENSLGDSGYDPGQARSDRVRQLHGILRDREIK